MRTQNIVNTVGKNLRLLRLNQGLSQTNLAEKLNISVPAYSKIETAVTDCKISRIWEFAAIFSVNVMQIILSEDDYRQYHEPEELVKLRNMLILKEEEIIKLQMRIISLYEELRDKI